MDEQQQQYIVYDEVLVVNGGGKTALALSTDGILRWNDHGEVLRCLSVEKEVIGVSIVGQQLLIKSILETETGGYCFGNSRRSLVRKSFIFEPFSDDSLRNLFDKIQGYINSLGTIFISVC